MAASKFIFQRAFPETPDRMVPLEKKEPTLTVSEHQRLLDAAVAAARIEAFQQGKIEAEADQTARLAEAMEQVARMLDQLRFELDGIHATASAEAIRFAHDFASKLAGQLLDQAPMAVIEATARAIFDDLRGHPHVAVRVAPDLVEAAKEKLAGIARERGFEGRLIVMGEPEIPPGDVRIEWADGGIVRDRAAIERTMAAGVERALSVQSSSAGVS
jgi:flagellar assembly protein FliH